MTDLDKAREWADRWSEDDPLILADAKAAIKLIKGLPDQWVDVEEVREVINGQLSVYTRGTASHYIAEEITRKLKEALIAPKLPTLADMTQEEREACQWMQCEVFTPTLNETFRGVLTHPGKEWATDLAKVLSPDGRFTECEHVTVTPLPDLSKLQWPGNEVVEPPALPEGMRLADHETYGRVVVSPKDDLDGDYRVFCSQDQTEYGDNWWYAHKSELTFLDGEA